MHSGIISLELVAEESLNHVTDLGTQGHIEAHNTRKVNDGKVTKSLRSFHLLLEKLCLTYVLVQIIALVV